ncbi:hypothetical protein GCM10022631_34340 [Deinococcus rubellus]|uniref:HK97 gp10 family phage protein n=1 Tax=Deinococcus rubellus TaxID=1889240 RepID=A0ABY5YHB4_9DEIO|nr:hypothetical protein [Deinococcus rubellus]UWX63492.1 hypothetical protein N0D28_12170 [Deinococcus rubellus]
MDYVLESAMMESTRARVPGLGMLARTSAGWKGLFVSDQLTQDILAGLTPFAYLGRVEGLAQGRYIYAAVTVSEAIQHGQQFELHFQPSHPDRVFYGPSAEAVYNYATQQLLETAES